MSINDSAINISEQMPYLAAAVRAGHVSAVAMVYVRDCDGRGLDIFLADMQQQGIDPDTLIEGKHFVINHADTKDLRPFTGELWIKASAITADLLYELMPWIIERNSNPKANKTGDMHLYNNPVFRMAIALGTWGEASGIVDLGLRTKLVDSKEFLDTKLSFIKKEMDEASANAKKADQMAKVMKNAKLHETSKEYAREARRWATKASALSETEQMLTKAV